MTVEDRGLVGARYGLEKLGDAWIIFVLGNDFSGTLRGSNAEHPAVISGSVTRDRAIFTVKLIDIVFPRENTEKTQEVVIELVFAP